MPEARIPETHMPENLEYLSAFLSMTAMYVHTYIAKK